MSVEEDVGSLFLMATAFGFAMVHPQMPQGPLRVGDSKQLPRWLQESVAHYGSTKQRYKNLDVFGTLQKKDKETEM